MEDLNEKIRRLRKEAGISQTEMAKAAGINQASFSNIEKGETKSISIEVGKGIARALNISFVELFDIPLSLKDTEVEDTEIAELRKQILELRGKVEDLNSQIDKNEKIISLQDQVNQNFKNAFLEAFLKIAVKQQTEINLDFVGPNGEKLEEKLIETYKKIIGIQSYMFFEQMISWGCFTQKEIELFIENNQGILKIPSQVLKP